MAVADDDSVFASLQQVAGVRYNRAEHNKDILDTYVLRKARQKGIRLPTGGSPDEYKYLGAHVETPRAGTSVHVIYVDVSSMYPSLIMTLNGSPETIVGTKDDLEDSQYTEDDCVWGYIDPRPVKHLGSDESYQNFTDGEYKMVYDPSAPETKWSCDDGDGPQYTKLYFLDHETEKGFLTECVEELIDLKNQYRGTSLYGSTKRVTNCFTADTEVMTPNGVCTICELEVGDDVYSFNPDTEEVEVKPVTETFAYPDYNGELVDIQTQYMNFSVTPNHRMLVRKDNPSPRSATWDEYDFVQAGELEPYSHYELPHDWDITHGESIETVDLTEYVDEYEVWVNPSVHGHTFRAEIDCEATRSQIYSGSGKRNGYRLSAVDFERNREYIEKVADEIFIHTVPNHKWIPKEYDGENFLQLLAWFITEGSTRVSGGDKDKYDTKRGYTYQIQISQDSGSTHDEIATLLDEMGLEPYTDEKGFSLSSKILYNILESLCGTNSFDKEIPDLIFNLDEKQKCVFFDTMIAGDGDSREASHRYTTSSEKLRDDFMRLCVHLGRNPRYNRDSDTWRIYYGQTKNSIRPNRSIETRQSKHGEGVYCVEVADNHTLLAGRGGKFQFVGQSVYGVSGFANEDSSFRLFDWRLAEAVTLSGRKMIQFSRDYVIDYLAEQGYDGAYAAMGDTDGVGISVPSAATRDEAMRVVGDGVESLNTDGYDEFFTQQMGVAPDTHHGEIEIESYSPQVFIPAKDLPHGTVGRKKRYIKWETWNDDDGECDEISITGLEYVRSDTAPIVQDAQYAFAETLRMDDSEGREYLYPRLREWAENVQGGDIDLDYVCKRGGIGQPLDEYGTKTRRASTFYRGCKYANQNIPGVTIQQGDKPRLVHIKRVPDEYPSVYSADTAEDGDPVDAITLPDPSKLPDGFEVDWDAHWTYFRDAMKPLLETRGWPWDDILHDHSQRSFEAFV